MGPPAPPLLLQRLESHLGGWARAALGVCVGNGGCSDEGNGVEVRFPRVEVEDSSSQTSGARVPFPSRRRSPRHGDRPRRLAKKRVSRASLESRGCGPRMGRGGRPGDRRVTRTRRTRPTCTSVDASRDRSSPRGRRRGDGRTVLRGSRCAPTLETHLSALRS